MNAFLLGAVMAVVDLAGCGRARNSEEAAESSVSQEAVPAVNPNAKPVDPATTGTISGIVKLRGTPPRMRTINMRSVLSCERMHATPPTFEDVVPGDNGTLQNVVVYLKGDFSPYSFPTATEPVKIDQQGCVYIPHVVAVTTQTPVQVHNSDSATHNSAALTKRNSQWNQTQSVGGPPVEHVFSVPEVAVSLKCSMHPWMKVHIAVFSHPYFQVTGKDGSFSLKNVPPGTYTLAAWQERYGTVEQTVTLAPRGEQTATFTFETGE